MCAKTVWAWCSPRSSRRIKRSWKNGWPTFATNTNAPRTRGSFPDKFSIRGNGAVERTRTSTVLLPPAPQAGASASSATTAFHRLADYRGERSELRGSRPLRSENLNQTYGFLGCSGAGCEFAGGCFAGGCVDCGCVVGAGVLLGVDCGAPGCGVPGCGVNVFGAAGFTGAGFENFSSTEPPCPTPLSVCSTRASAQTMNITAHQVVARESTVAAPRGPNAVWLPAPPKAPAMSAALPLCSSTTMIRNKQFTTKNVGNSHENQRESESRHPRTINANPAASATAHFIQPGIYKPHTNSKMRRAHSEQLLRCFATVYYRRERLRVQAGPADQRAVQLFLSHQSLDVVGFDAAAVQNTQGLGLLGGELSLRALAKKTVRRGGNFWRCRLARADSPDWLVS